MRKTVANPVLSVANLRDLNSYEVTGQVRRGYALDAIVLTHLQLVAELRKLTAAEELICRLVVEGFTQMEIAAELGCSQSTIGRYLRQLRWTLYGVDAADARAKQQAVARGDGGGAAGDSGDCARRHERRRGDGPAAVENLQRADLHPVEEAEGYRALMAHGETAEDVAKKSRVNTGRASGPDLAKVAASAEQVGA